MWDKSNIKCKTKTFRHNVIIYVYINLYGLLEKSLLVDYNVIWHFNWIFGGYTKQFGYFGWPITDEKCLRIFFLFLLVCRAKIFDQLGSKHLNMYQQNQQILQIDTAFY